MMPGALALFLFVFSCGGKPEFNSEFEKIRSSQFVFDISILDGVGFKEVRQYDIADCLMLYLRI